MKRFFKYLTILFFLASAFTAQAAPLTVPQGGTSVNSITGIISGNGTAPFTPVTIGTGLSFDGTTLSATGTSGGVSLAPTTIAFGSATSSITSDPNFTWTTNGLSLFSDGGYSSGFGNVQQKIISDGSESGLLLSNTGTGGLDYSIISTSNASGIGGGNFSIGNASTGNQIFTIDNANNTTFNSPHFTVTSYNCCRQISVGDDTGIQQFGDLDGDSSWMYLNINGPSQQISFQQNTSQYLLLDTYNRLYQLGDISEAGNGNHVSINDNLGTFDYFMSGNGSNPIHADYLGNAQIGDWNVDTFHGMGLFVDQSGSAVFLGNDGTLPGSNGSSMSINDGNQSIALTAGTASKGSFYYQDTLGNPYIEAKNAGGNWYFGLGDLEDAYNGTALSIADNSSTITNTGNIFQVTATSGNSRLYTDDSFSGFGDLNNQADGNYIALDNSANQIYFSNTGNINGMSLNFAGGQYSFGDFFGVGNNSYFQINDFADQYVFNQPNFNIAGASYVFPNSYGGGTTVLQNDGSGNLSWQPLSAGTVTSVNTDATLTGGPITTSGSLGINLGNPNNWGGTQTFGNNISFGGAQVNASGLTTNDVLTYNGSNWVNSQPTNGVVASGYFPNQIATQVLATYTNSTGSDHSYNIGGYINVTSISAAALIVVTATWTDEIGSQSLTYLSTAGAGVTAFPVRQIRAVSGSAITIVATVTTAGPSPIYDAGGSIQFIY